MMQGEIFMSELSSAALPQRCLVRAWCRGTVVWLRCVGVAVCTFALNCVTVHAQQVLQRGYNPGVSGANLAETVLNSSNVGPNTFGLLFNLPVSGSIYAQPLYMPRVVVAKRIHKVVYVATMNDVLYAFDADTMGAPLWSVDLAALVGATPVPIAQFTFSGNRNIVGNLGILSTPVIDAASHLMYVVACTLEAGTMVYRLHSIDIRSGAEPLGPGVQISGSYGGLTFDARYVTQRVSLTLAGNQVVFGFGAVELEFPGGYSGWMMAYDKTTLQQSGVFATVTTGTNGGGVWQSGRPPVVGLGGDVFVFTGNGYTNGYDGISDFSESVLKLNPAKGLRLVDWFTPGDWSSLDSGDLDLSSSGPFLIPGTKLLAGGGKNGELYILNTNNLGKFNANDSQVVQKELVSAGSLRGGPVFWKRSAEAGGSLLFVWGTNDGLKAFPFNGTMIAATPSAEGGNLSQIFPGGILALSANGEQHGSGVLWASIATSGDANNNPPVPGALQAFDAENVANELWSSTTNPSRDSYGNFAKFVPPLIVNGKVYVATSSGQLAVYGLLQ
jgi:PQQ enzyme repeat